MESILVAQSEIKESLSMFWRRHQRNGRNQIKATKQSQDNIQHPQAWPVTWLIPLSISYFFKRFSVSDTRKGKWWLFCSSKTNVSRNYKGENYQLFKSWRARTCNVSWNPILTAACGVPQSLKQLPISFQFSASLKKRRHERRVENIMCHKQILF